MPHNVGVLFAAAIAGWATVAGGMTLASLLLIAFSSGAANLLYLIPMTLITVVASFLAAIPLSMGAGLIALATVRRLKLEKWWQWSAFGIVTGLAIVLVLAIIPTPIAPMIVAPVVALFAIAGAIAGTVAWRENRKRIQPA